MLLFLQLSAGLSWQSQAYLVFWLLRTVLAARCSRQSNCTCIWDQRRIPMLSNTTVLLFVLGDWRVFPMAAISEHNYLEVAYRQCQTLCHLSIRRNHPCLSRQKPSDTAHMTSPRLPGLIKTLPARRTTLEPSSSTPCSCESPARSSCQCPVVKLQF